MKMNKWAKVAITVAAVLLGAMLGLMIGPALDHANFLGEVGYGLNITELTSIIMAIAAGSGCVVYFQEK